MIALIFLLTFSLCLAHDLWLEKREGKMVLYYGHLDPKPGEEKFIKYKTENVLKALCFNKEGNGMKVAIKEDYPFSFPMACSAYYVLFSTGYWTKGVQGLKNLPKDRVESPLESWLSYESVKRMEEWSEAFKRPLTEDLEIVPLEDPFNLKLYDKVRLRVYYRGKPVKGVVVLHNNHIAGTTEEDGGINVRIKGKGLQRISTSIKERADGIKADYIIKSTSLIFEVR